MEKIIRYLLFFFLILTYLVTCGLFFTSVQAQNLVPNGDFEIFTTCPDGINNIAGPPLECIPWTAPSTASTDYFNVCASSLPYPGSTAGVPFNSLGVQNPHSGAAYCGLYVKVWSLEYREYLMAPLESPLVAGTCYEVSFFVSLNDQGCGADRIGAYLSQNPPPPNGVGVIQVTPQINAEAQYYTDKVNWTYIHDYYLASGGESYITIGNFYNDIETTFASGCSGDQWVAYYYIDDVVVEEAAPVIDLELNGPVSVCDSYEIDPGLTGYDFLWSDGSTSPTLTVSVSGIYSLTVSSTCVSVEDEIEVIITNQPPVSLPDPFVLCEGESYMISLDPNAGAYEWDDGTTGPEYTITDAGTYQVTLDDGCDVSTDLINVTLATPPDLFSLGLDVVLCPGDEIEYTFDPDLGDFHWQDGSTSNAVIIFQPGQYSVTISNICGETHDDVEITAQVPPLVDLPDSTKLCTGDEISYNLDTIMGEFHWQDGSTNPIYLITEPGQYAVTISNECGSSHDQIIVTDVEPPVLDFGSSVSGCVGDTIVLNGHDIAGNYVWQDGSTDYSFVVTSSGTYNLTITNDCGVASDSVRIDLASSFPPPDLGPDISLCPGEQILLSLHASGADILWQDSSTADSFLITTAGMYFVQVSNACYSYSDTIEISVNTDPPKLDLPSQILICHNASLTLDAGISDVTFSWNDGSQNQTLLVNSPGEYSLTVSNACGSDADTVSVSDGGDAPFVSLGIDTVLCPGDSFLLNPVYSDVVSWLWSDGTASNFISVSDSGSVDVIVSNLCGLAYDTIHIDLHDAIPVLNLGADTSLCPGESITLSISIPNVDIAWSDGTNTSALTLDSSGAYYATISNVCGNSSDTLNIGVLDDIPDIDLGPDLPLCPGEMLVIAPGIAGVSYLWQDGSVDTFFLVDHEQTMMVTITNACGNASDTLQIFTSTDGPEVNLGDDILGCEGEAITIMSDLSGVDFMWQDGSTGSSYTTVSSGLFYLQVTNACGTDTDTIEVDIHGTSPYPDLGTDTLLCEGTALTLTSNADTETMTTWQDGSALPTFFVTSPGTYILTHTNRCGVNKDSINVSYQSLPVHFELGPDTVLCPGESLILNSPVTSDHIEWQDGSSQDNYLVTQAGNYSLTLSNKCGTSQDEIKIEIESNVPQFPAVHQDSLCAGHMLNLDVLQAFDAAYLWNTGSNSPLITIDTPGLYQVTVTTNCQEVTHEINVIPGEDCGDKNDFYIPNIISPNGDNINDLFTMFINPNIEVLSMEGTIFDRWGDHVFSSTEIPFEWDGNFGDQKVMPGVYVYKLQLKYIFNGKEISELFVGDVTVVR